MRYIDRAYIFCMWIWILTFLYYFDFIKFSPLYLSFFALIFSIYYNFSPYHKGLTYFQKINVLYFELFILLINIRKHFFIDNNKLINISHIFYSIIFFFIYLLVLKIVLNKTFYQYYFIDLMKK